MDPITLATSAIGFLAPYLAKAGKFVAEEAGPALQKVKAIHKAVKEALADDALGKQTLERVEQNPEELETWQDSLTKLLETKIKGDAALAETLQKLLVEAEKAGAEKTITQSVNLSDSAKVGNITQIGEVGGDVDLSKKA